jgi:hypothetical protein
MQSPIATNTAAIHAGMRPAEPAAFCSSINDHLLA